MAQSEHHDCAEPCTLSGDKADIAQALLQYPSVTALFNKGSQTVLSGIRHGDITEILDGISNTATVVQVILAHKSCTSEAHDDRRFCSKCRCQSQSPRIHLGV